MSGFGRVNTMVDGITQSFYGTSTSEQRRMVQLTIWLAYLWNPNLLVAVDVTR